MRLIAIRLAASSLLSCVALAAVAAELLPVKPGLWEARSSALDPDGHEMAPPEQAALSRLPPEARARMAEVMKARGIAMPDANGATKVCFTKEMLESGGWEQTASEAGCTTTFSSRSGSTWKWHSSCTKFQSESDGETVFASPESYRTKVTTTVTLKGKTNTSTRIVQAKWLGATCGDIKPITPKVGK